MAEVSFMAPGSLILYVYITKKFTVMITFMNISSAITFSARLYSWEVNIDSGNGLLLSGNKPLLIQNCIIIWHRLAPMV